MIRNFAFGVLFFVGIAVFGFFLQASLGQGIRILVFFMTNLIDDVFLILLFWNSSRFFLPMHSRGTISLYHTLPVRQSHKYTMSVVMVFVFQALLFFLATLLSYTVLRLLFSGQLTISQIFGSGDVRVFPPFIQDLDAGGVGLLILRYSTFNVLYFFGAIFFRSRHFLKTSFSLLALGTILSWTVFFFAQNYLSLEIFQTTGSVLAHVVLLPLGYRLLCKHSIVKLKN